MIMAIIFYYYYLISSIIYKSETGSRNHLTFLNYLLVIISFNFYDETFKGDMAHFFKWIWAVENTYRDSRFCGIKSIMSR